MNKLILSPLIFLDLLSLKIRFKTKSYLRDHQKINAFKPLSKKVFSFNIKTSLQIINFFYKNKFFSCLICSLLVKNIIKNEGAYIHIGVMHKNNEKSFHAWVENNGHIIFGNHKFLSDFITLHKI